MSPLTNQTSSSTLLWLGWDMESRSGRGCSVPCLGDALGLPVEFMDLKQIKTNYGSLGVTGYSSGSGRKAPFTDDTQMTLWTAEGLIRPPSLSIPSSPRATFESMFCLP